MNTSKRCESLKRVLPILRRHLTVNTLLVAGVLALLLAGHVAQMSHGWQSNRAIVRLTPVLVMLRPLSSAEFVAATPRVEVGSVGESLDKALAVQVDTWLRAVESPYTRATGYLITGQPRTARMALPLSDDSFRARWLLALTYARQGQLERVPALFLGVQGAERALFEAGMFEQDHHNELAATQLLQLAESVGRPEEVNLSRLYSTVVVNYANIGQLDLALVWSERWVTATHTDVEAIAGLAGVYIWRHQPDLAYATWQRVDPIVARQDPSYAGDMGQIYEAWGQWDLAYEMYQEAWQRHPGDPNYAWYLGQFLARQGRVSEALPYLQLVARNGREGLRQAAEQRLLDLKAK